LAKILLKKGSLGFPVEMSEDSITEIPKEQKKGEKADCISIFSPVIG
jgi:hypothetical protein